MISKLSFYVSLIIALMESVNMTLILKPLAYLTNSICASINFHVFNVLDVQCLTNSQLFGHLL